MSSTPFSPKDYVQILDRAVELLDEEYLTRTIDVPLERTSETFILREGSTCATANELDLLPRLGLYLQFLYAHGLRVPRRLPACQAEAEAVFLLESDYQSASGRGYEAALVDAREHGQEGVLFLCGFLLEAVKREQRRKHVNWVTKCSVDPLDWDQKVTFTQLLLERLRGIGCELFDNERPSRFADYTADLLSMYVGEVTKYQNWLRQP